MLWSLIKILIFVAIVALLALGAGYLMESQGGVQITLAGTEYTLGPLQSVMAAAVLVILVWLGLKLLSLLVATLHFLNGDETALSRYFDRNREKKGFEALSDGLLALASGEAKQAMSKAAKAEKYLQKPELTNLLTAQAAEMAGDTNKATETYKKLIQNDSTRFVGVRGIMKQKLSEGDTATARKLAEKAFQLKPRHEETQDVLLKLQAQARDWSGARNTLNAKLKSGSLPRDVVTRREAVLALSEAQDIIAEGTSIEGQEQAIEANRLSPDLVPAAAMAARSYIAADKPRKAIRVLKKAWDAQPHPDLAAAFAEIKPTETAAERVKRFGTLTNIRPQHPETRLVRAELNIVAEDFPEARRALGDLAETAADARALTLMAAIERGEGAPDSVVQGWLTKALNAPRGPQWVCENCNHIHGVWSPVCESCESFDTLAWKVPQTPEISSATGAHLLPLIAKGPEPVDIVPDAEILDADSDATDVEDAPDTEIAGMPQDKPAT
ncbi:heme biosynthesis protein HemY [Sedimentitalea todarodis]|uniref:Heme biosynthesis HemY N-terminal domain-containing protein n=1 Tax=Sedimentitalea todarodis TaxID=1631240 RepID=A0ABU3VG44_9RHOB|nr:heme biosynthesis HemY N-terminal domain-containing protein [Sedimentitalea todarodis]MDU9005157.1 heme biosynthesis HemY N-terminal domain-containing protein [Sedimentitalea todarodis]